MNDEFTLIRGYKRDGINIVEKANEFMWIDGQYRASVLWTRRAIENLPLSAYDQRPSFLIQEPGFLSNRMAHCRGAAGVHAWGLCWTI